MKSMWRDSPASRTYTTSAAVTAVRAAASVMARVRRLGCAIILSPPSVLLRETLFHVNASTISPRTIRIEPVRFTTGAKSSTCPTSSNPIPSANERVACGPKFAATSNSCPQTAGSLRFLCVFSTVRLRLRNPGSKSFRFRSCAGVAYSRFHLWQSYLGSSDTGSDCCSTRTTLNHR